VKELPDPQHVPKSVAASPTRSEPIESDLSSADSGGGQAAIKLPTNGKDDDIEASGVDSRMTPKPEPSAPQPKKRVSFANDTKQDEQSEKARGSIKRKASKAITASPGSYHRSLEDVGALEPDFQPTRTRNSTTEESYEDAELLHQMLQYNMNEVGAIVAQIDLDENNSSVEDSDEDLDDHGSTTDDEEDDEYGRTTKRVIDDEYRNKMLELERRLVSKLPEKNGLTSPTRNVTTTGKGPEEAQNTVHLDGTGATKHEVKKKGVRFANELDVASVPRGAAFDEEGDIATKSSTTPVSDIIRERESSQPGSGIGSNESKKVSKFKSLAMSGTPRELNGRRDNLPKPRSVMNGPLAQGDLESWLKPVSSTKASKIVVPTIDGNQNRSRTVPEGPPGKTHAAVLVERPLTESSEAITDPDEFDPALMQQEITAEYYRMRNRMVQRNGGFLKEEDEPAQVSLSELEEAECGKKISKFKAARLAKLSK
jgi:unconventional prefoldin RPB5 interactor 1